MSPDLGDTDTAPRLWQGGEGLGVGRIFLCLPSLLLDGG